MKLVMTVSLLSTAILLMALGYIFMHPVRPTLKVSAATNNFVYVPTRVGSPHLHEMSRNERNQCAGTYVDRGKSMMRCTLPDDGSFIRSDQ